MYENILYILTTISTFILTTIISFCITYNFEPDVYDFIIEYDKRNIMKHSVDEDSGVDNEGHYWIVV
ncbi:hypothetical protein N5S72_10220 [Aliarcobacter cryaerophilus]|uniref:hypothetical protein n=1 Tax=Aliarcobacter cryaerophilus TaxID=28198 RepID=UPI0021B1E450|nr:hypothetical protein [Aliarcobacter cryaerophilus]MCT7464610.1 hypothetical protein [Aliarcobacter cryaerophilus]MCT7464825.1 hypothetical protein [Aliarcobacter cryaerophilus]